MRGSSSGGSVAFFTLTGLVCWLAVWLGVLFGGGLRFLLSRAGRVGLLGILVTAGYCGGGCLLVLWSVYVFKLEG